MAAEKRNANSDDEGTNTPPVTAVPSRPPLKKRFISNVNIHQQRAINRPQTPTTPTTPATPATTTVVKPPETQQQQQQQQQTAPSPPPPPATATTSQATTITPVTTTTTTTTTKTPSPPPPPPPTAKTTQSPVSASPTTTTSTEQSQITSQNQVAESVPMSTRPQETETSSSSSSTIESLNNETELNFETESKAVLLREMRLAKEQVLSRERKLESLEEHCLSQETKQGLYRIHLKLIQAQIGFMTSEQDLAFISLHDIDFTHLKSTHDGCLKALDSFAHWYQQLTQLERRFHQETDPLQRRNMAIDFVKREVETLTRLYHQNQRFLDDMHKRMASINVEDMMNTVRFRQSQLDQAKEQLNNVTMEWRMDAKKRDRAESKVVAALAFGGLGDMEPMDVDNGEENSNNNNSSSNSGDNSNSNNNGGSSSGSGNNNNNPRESATPMTGIERDSSSRNERDEHQHSELMTERDSKNRLSELNLILTAREKEIEQLKRDRQSLVHEEERLISLFQQLSEERLLETDYVKSLKLSIDHYRDRCMDLEAIRNSVKREADKLLDAQKQVDEQIHTEKTSQLNILESEMKRLEENLGRIRNQRDSYQQTVEENKLKNAKERENREKLVAFSEERQDRIASLNQSIEELKNEQEMTGSLSDEYNTYLRLRNELNELKITASSLECIENNTPINNNASQLAALEHHLKKWKSNSHIISYDDELKESQKLKSLIDFFETYEPKLLGEIDRVAGIYTKLEEQQSKQVVDPTELSDQLSKIQGEKLRYAQTFPGLIAQKEKQIASVATLRVTREKQQDLIKQLEEKEKSLEAQVIEKEIQVRDTIRKIEMNKTDLEDMTYYCTDIRNSLDYSQTMITELQKMLKEKSKLLDEENQLGSEIEENHRKMKKKWELISQGNNPAKEQLEKECDDLMAMIKCSTCRTRFKTKILIRCMHTFCKPCIEARLETRQRRCPTCSESFGASDVRHFHL